MQIKRYNLGNAVGTAVQSIGTSMALTRGETAITYLPTDTKFALAVEAIEKNFADTFMETDVNLMTMNANISSEGVVGRFMGYLAMSDNKLRFYKALDEDITKGRSVQTDVASQSQPINLDYEMDIAAASVQMQWGKYIITDGSKKFMLVNAWKIFGTEGHFDSSFGGFQMGLKPMFAYIDAHGGTVKVSNSSNIFAIIILVLMAAAFVFLILAKKH